MNIDEIYQGHRLAYCARATLVVSELGPVNVSFGKYCGMALHDIPLRYLDETLACVVPATFIVRAAARFVDACCTVLYQLHGIEHADALRGESYLAIMSSVARTKDAQHPDGSGDDQSEPRTTG